MATAFYKSTSPLPDKISGSIGGLYRSAYHKFYIDEIYTFITGKILFNLVGRPAAWFDRNIVDGLMNGLASMTAAISGLIKGLQSGKVQDYALFFFIGLFILAALAVHYFN